MDLTCYRIVYPPDSRRGEAESGIAWVYGPIAGQNPSCDLNHVPLDFYNITFFLIMIQQLFTYFLFSIIFEDTYIFGVLQYRFLLLCLVCLTWVIYIWSLYILHVIQIIMLIRIYYLHIPQTQQKYRIFYRITFWTYRIFTGFYHRS